MEFLCNHIQLFHFSKPKREKVLTFTFRYTLVLNRADFSAGSFDSSCLPLFMRCCIIHDAHVDEWNGVTPYVCTCALLCMYVNS